MLDQFFTFSPNLTRKSFDGFIILTFSSVDMVLVSYGLEAGDVQMYIINKHF